MLRGVDRAAFAVAMATRLRAGGVAVGFTGIETFVRALEPGLPDSMARLYWTARVSFVGRQSELAAFDAVFAAIFGGVGLLDSRPTAEIRLPGRYAATSRPHLLRRRGRMKLTLRACRG